MQVLTHIFFGISWVASIISAYGFGYSRGVKWTRELFTKANEDASKSSS